MGNYFLLTSDEVASLRGTGVETEEIPICCHIARYSGSSAESIAKMRAQGDSWAQIVEDQGLGMGIFYKMVVGYSVSETYYPILAKFDAVSSKQWKNLDLSDEEILNLVNLRFIGSQHDYSAYKVMGLRDEGLDFVRINRDIGDAKQELLAEQARERRAVANASF